MVVLATLADGSTMRIGTSNPIFDALFAIDHAGNETETMVTIYPLDEDGAKISGRSQYKEIGYTFEGGNYSLHCEGKPGAVGSEENTWQGGGLYYNGQRGEDGPDVTVEITTLSSSNPGALRFRLRCGDEEKVFNGSATTEVIVSTTGGRGGHAIPKGDGNASNGGNGGNGGDITVLVDPSVRRYNLRAGSNGGKGGAGSRNKSSTFGNGFAGNDGQEGHISERRQPVSIP